jgi:hypothetical protein
VSELTDVKVGILQDSIKLSNPRHSGFVSKDFSLPLSSSIEFTCVELEQADFERFVSEYYNIRLIGVPAGQSVAGLSRSRQVTKVSPAKRSTPQRGAARRALSALYPDSEPLGTIKVITAAVNDWLRKTAGSNVNVSEDTVKRALDAHQPQSAQEQQE